MGTVDESLPLWSLTIPGTHDTLARFGGDLAICQSLSLPEQLEAGVRFLDVRARHLKNKLPIHHGILYQVRPSSLIPKP